MKITKKGNIKSEYKRINGNISYRYTCLRCGCVFTFNGGDVINCDITQDSDSGPIFLRYIKCPMDLCQFVARFDEEKGNLMCLGIGGKNKKPVEDVKDIKKPNWIFDSGFGDFIMVVFAILSILAPILWWVYKY